MQKADLNGVGVTGSRGEASVLHVIIPRQENPKASCLLYFFGNYVREVPDSLVTLCLQFVFQLIHLGAWTGGDANHGLLTPQRM
jgi:hypothetical protein